MNKLLLLLGFILPLCIFSQTDEERAKAKELGLSDYQIIELGKLAKTRNAFDAVPVKTISDDVNDNDEVVVDTIVADKSDVEKLSSNNKIESNSESNKAGFGYDIFTKTDITNFDVESNFFAGEDYTLGIGDQIGISIWGASNFSNSYVIGNTGAIEIERVGRIYLHGIDLGKAREIIKKRLAAVFNLSNSSLEINLMYSRDLFVHIVGDVKIQGTFKIKGYHSVFNALYLSKGILESGSLREVKVKRDGKVVHTLDIYRYLMDSTYDSRFSLKNNDFIIVGSRKKVIALEGMVKKPFKYELKKKEGLRELINYAGGLSASAYKKSVKVIRVTDTNEEIIDVDWASIEAEGENFLLEDGDKVFVRETPGYINNIVKIEGAVNIPGEYQLDDSMTVYDLIMKAEGLKDEAYDDRFYLVRTKENFEKHYESLNGIEIIKDQNSSYNIPLQAYDVIKIFSRKDFIENDSVYIWGAVRKPGKFVYGDGMNVKDLLYLAGGLKREAAISRIEISRIVDFDKDLDVFRPSRTIVKTIQLDFNMKVSEQDEVFELKPLDQIFVRKEPNYQEQRNVTLIGEFKYPGTYSLLTNNYKLTDVIKRAGGLTEWAFLEGTKLYRSENNMGYLFVEMKKIIDNPKSDFNYVLKANDTIYVPQINDLVSINGAIEFPKIDSIGQINTPYIKGKRARYYVKKFGVDFDRSKGAVRRKTTVTLPNGIVVKTKNFGLFKVYPKVHKGSLVTVNIKEKKAKKQKQPSEPVDWNELFENFTVKVSGILTLYFLISRING